MDDRDRPRVRGRGDISVEPVTRIPNHALVYIIMGPTGAGKSTFIEAFAGGLQNLAISSDQLAGFTQRVTAYKLVNVIRKYTSEAIYLIDTPGFSDSKISEIEVIEMLRDWLKENCAATVYTILFLTPITVTRLPGSRRRTIKMLKESLGDKAHKMTVTTTMWDTLHSERTRSRAEKNFEQLRADVFKASFGNQETNVMRFMGTMTSAFQVMDDSLLIGRPFDMLTSTPSTDLYCDLHERIEGALQKKVMIESDLAHSDAQTNKNLKDILEKEQKENDEILAKFISQLVKFGEPPHEFQEGAQALRKTIIENIVPADHRMRDNFQQWTEEPEIGSGLVADPKPTETILAMLTGEDGPGEHDSVDHRPSKKLDFTETFRRLLKSAKIHRPKWLKRAE